MEISVDSADTSSGSATPSWNLDQWLFPSGGYPLGVENRADSAAQCATVANNPTIDKYHFVAPLQNASLVVRYVPRGLRAGGACTQVRRLPAAVPCGVHPWLEAWLSAACQLDLWQLQGGTRARGHYSVGIINILALIVIVIRRRQPGQEQRQEARQDHAVGFRGRISFGCGHGSAERAAYGAQL